MDIQFSTNVPLKGSVQLKVKTSQNNILILNNITALIRIPSLSPVAEDSAHVVESEDIIDDQTLQKINLQTRNSSHSEFDFFLNTWTNSKDETIICNVSIWGSQEDMLLHGNNAHL